MGKEFLGFLKHYGVLGLAIGVIIGGKANELVSSLVNDLLLPVFFQPVLKATAVDNVRELNWHGIFYGKVLGSMVDFLIVAFLIFLFAKYVLREEAVAKK